MIKLNKKFFPIILLICCFVFCSCSNNKNQEHLEKFIKQAYIPEENDVYKENNSQALGEGVDKGNNAEDNLGKYFEEKFTPVMTEEGFNSFRAQNPLIWLGPLVNNDDFKVSISDLQINEEKPNKASDDFNYYSYELTLEISKNDSDLKEQLIKGNLRVTKDGLIDNFRQESPLQIP